MLNITKSISFATMLILAWTFHSPKAVQGSGTFYSVIQLDFEDELLPQNNDSAWVPWPNNSGTANFANNNGPSIAGTKALEIDGNQELGWSHGLDGIVGSTQDWAFQIDVRPISVGGVALPNIQGVFHIDYYFDDDRVVSASTTIAQGQWATLLLESDVNNNLVRKYVNGVFVDNLVPQIAGPQHDPVLTEPYLAFGGANNGSTFRGQFDNVSFAVVVPEPSTLVLAALGLVGIGYRRHRKKT